MEQKTLTIQQTREALGLSKTKIHELINLNELVRLKVGRRTLITAASVDAFIERHVQAAEDRGL
jgi:excisionase family DNA binding protein